MRSVRRSYTRSISGFSDPSQGAPRLLPKFKRALATNQHPLFGMSGRRPLCDANGYGSRLFSLAAEKGLAHRRSMNAQVSDLGVRRWSYLPLTRTPSEPAELRKQHYPKCLQAPRGPIDEAVDVLYVLPGL